MEKLLKKRRYCCHKYRYKKKFNYTACGYVEDYCTMAPFKQFDYYCRFYKVSLDGLNGVIETMCLNCYSFPRAFIPVHDVDNLRLTKMVSRDHFKFYLKLDKLIPEDLVKCHKCKKLFHRVCVLYNKVVWDDGPYVCATCSADPQWTHPKNGLRAEQLPHSRLSISLQEKVAESLAYTDIRIEVRVVSNTVINQTCTFHDKLKLLDGALIRDTCRIRKTIMGFVVPKNPAAEKDFNELCFCMTVLEAYKDGCSEKSKGIAQIESFWGLPIINKLLLRNEIHKELVLAYMKALKIAKYKALCIDTSSLKRSLPFRPPLERCTIVNQYDAFNDLLKITIDIGQVTHQTFKQYCDQYENPSIDDIPCLPGTDIINVMGILVEQLTTDELAQMNDEQKLEEKKNIFKTIFSETKGGSSCNFYILNDEDAVGPTEDYWSDVGHFCPVIIDHNYFREFQRDYHLEFSSTRWNKFSTMIILRAVHENCKYYQRWTFRNKLTEQEISPPVSTYHHEKKESGIKDEDDDT